MNYLSLPQYLLVAEVVTGVSATVLEKAARVDLADSALHAPSAGWGEDDFYPDPTDKAAVLLVHLIRNHPLPDGNKRTSWTATRWFVRMNGGVFAVPSAAAVEQFVVAIAAGDIDEDQAADWLRQYVTWPSS